MGIFDRFRKPLDEPEEQTLPVLRSRFSRPEGEIAGPFPSEDALQTLLGLRLMDACHDPFNEDPPSGSPLSATMWWVSIQPSFHAWAELGLVRTRRDGVTVGYRIGMVVGGCPAASAVADLASMEEPSFAPPELWPAEPEGGSMLDGCSYCVTFAHPGSVTTIRFQPVEDMYCAWTQQFFSLAERLQQQTEKPALKSYLDVWREYLSG